MRYNLNISKFNKEYIENLEYKYTKEVKKEYENYKKEYLKIGKLLIEEEDKKSKYCIIKTNEGYIIITMKGGD